MYFYINFGILVIYVTASGPCIDLRHYVVLTAPVIWVLAWDFLRETDFEFVVESTDRPEPVHQTSIQRSASQHTSFYTYCVWIVNRALCVIMCWVEGAGLTRWCSQLCKWDSKGKPALVFKDKRLSIVVFSWPHWLGRSWVSFARNLTEKGGCFCLLAPKWMLFTFPKVVMTAECFNQTPHHFCVCVGVWSAPGLPWCGFPGTQLHVSVIHSTNRWTPMCQLCGTNYTKF